MLFSSMFFSAELFLRFFQLFSLIAKTLRGALGKVPYCLTDDVKLLLHISQSENEWDEEIDATIPSAEAIVDAMLKAEGLTVPAIVPRVVRDAAACFAAWLFRRRRSPQDAETFWHDANRFLTVYVEAEREPYIGRA